MPRQNNLPVAFNAQSTIESVLSKPALGCDSEIAIRVTAWFKLHVDATD
jgi:hypothetical protein